MHDAMAMRSGVSYSAYSDTQRAELRSRVLDFLMGVGGGSEAATAAAAGTAGAGAESIEPLELHSLRHMKEILFACRVSEAWVCSIGPVHGELRPTLEGMVRVDLACMRVTGARTGCTYRDWLCPVFCCRAALVPRGSP